MHLSETAQLLQECWWVLPADTGEHIVSYAYIYTRETNVTTNRDT